MATVLIIAFSDLKRDPRVRRQLMFLRDTYRVTAMGLNDPEISDVDFIQIQHLQHRRMNLIKKVYYATVLKTKQFEKFYWSRKLVCDAIEAVRDMKFDLILANDVDTLPFAIRMAEDWKAKVIFDAHEYAPREYEDKWFFRFFFQDYVHYLCSRYIPKVDAMVAVSEGIAEEYNRVYGVSCGVLTNAPFYEDLKPAFVKERQIRLVHHGLAHPSRGLENLINLMNRLDERFTLDLILIVNDNRYFQKLDHLAKRLPRVVFRTSVPMWELPLTLREYDIGIYLLSPASFNSRLALPNKLFEFIQGRLCLAIWPSPEMEKVVREYNCGVVAKNFSLTAMGEKLNGLTADEIWHFKQQSHKAARALCAENNRHILLDLVQNFVG